jgi:2-oxoglutarate ferredoxin oxidoreductase subunit beta
MSKNPQPLKEKHGAHPLDDLIRTDRIPHIWCPGCGIGTVFSSCLTAIKATGIPYNEFAMVSGIGCSGRATAYLDFCTLHTTHGRALTFSTGLKLANPKLKIITIMGDGDSVAIGGNHFIHAARRNMDITALIVNNSIYGMTGGQVSPGTPQGTITTTTPYGHLENPFDICELAKVVGSNFVARSTVYNVHLTEKLIGQAIQKKGFSVVEVISQCPVHYGKRTGFKSAVAMLEWQRDNAVMINKSQETEQKELPPGKFPIGVMVDREAKGYIERLEEFNNKQREKANAL